MNWVKQLLARRRMYGELSEEIRAHLDEKVDELVAGGMARRDAQAKARREFGNVTLTTEDGQAVWRSALLANVLMDVQYGMRMLRKNPGFTAVAVLTLALGIGANTAIFSFMDAVLLRALPVVEPQRLVVFRWTAREKPKFNGHSAYGDCDDAVVECTFSGPFYETLRTQAKSFSGLAAFAGPLETDLSGMGPAVIARGEYISGDFFSTLGVKMALGRPLGREDDSRSAPPAIVLTYRYWQTAFGGARSVIGRTVWLDNTSVTIAGVAEPQFTSLTPGKSQDYFLPLSLSDRVQPDWWGHDDRLADASSWWIAIVGRLKPGVSLAEAQAEATLLFRNELVDGAKPLLKDADEPAISLAPARQGLNGASSEIANMVYMMMVAVGFVLLIACANVAGLLAARAANRQKEMALRLALGAGRRRIVWQLLTESTLLSLFGGALGALVAVWGVAAITNVVSSSWGAGFAFVVAPDWRVLSFTIAVTFAAGFLFGLAPAWNGSRAELTAGLKENEVFLGATKTRRLRLGNALVMAQIALSVVVLAGAGLLVRTLHNLHQLNPGFDARNILLFGIDPTIAGYHDEQTAQLYQSLAEQFAALPGVISATYSEDALVSGSWSAGDVHLDGAPPKSNANTATLTVGPDFFSTMRIPIMAGRAFTPADVRSAIAAKAADEHAATKPAAEQASRTEAAPIPTIINETFARKFFRNENPIGKHMGNPERGEPRSGPQPGYVIVGVAGNTKYRDLRRAFGPTVYWPLTGGRAHFELRTAGSPTALVGLVRDVVSRADKNLPLFEMRTQAEQIERSLYQERLLGRLSSFFGVLVLVLACIGLYGLLAYDTARRTREVGIRIALGASGSDVLRLVVRRGVALLLVGAVGGIAAALAVTRFMASMLYDVRPNDPTTIVGVALLLGLVALAACWIPARRAMRVDPMVALRYE